MLWYIETYLNDPLIVLSRDPEQRLSIAKTNDSLLSKWLLIIIEKS